MAQPRVKGSRSWVLSNTRSNSKPPIKILTPRIQQLRTHSSSSIQKAGRRRATLEIYFASPRISATVDLLSIKKIHTDNYALSRTRKDRMEGFGHQLRRLGHRRRVGRSGRQGIDRRAASRA